METINSPKNIFSSEALTFDDVLLVPRYSEVLPRDVDIKTRITRKIEINAPLVSAAMDTVTEYQLAIAMAKEGGIGIIHKNMSIEKQADHVRNVKRSESGMILDPVTLTSDGVVADALLLMSRYKIGGIPIVDKDQKLIGILTNRDLRFEKDLNKPIRLIMTKEDLVTVPKGTTLDQAREILQKHKIEKLPVVDSSNKLVGLITYKDIMKLESFPNAAKDSHGRLRVGAAIGVAQESMERLEALIKMDVDVICVDTAHGHSAGVLEMIRKIKKTYPDLQVIGGNVATESGAKALIEAGVDGMKIGVGPGSICTTRIIAGVGVPQLTAIFSAAKAAHKEGIPVIADGGIRYTGDIAKAIAAGADCVMAGSLFAGTEEAPGETVIFQGRKFKIYRGMGSLSAMELGSKDRYFQDVEDDINKLVPEGIEGRVPYKGTVSEVMVQYIGGLRAGMGYCGAASIKELQFAKMIKMTAAGVRESHPHNVSITKEAPNYTSRIF